MKVVFLDFDGVIRVPEPAYPLEAQFCAERMGRVRELLETCDARLVVSSDWRLHHDYERILGILEPRIEREWLHRDWRTPSLRDIENEESAPRGAEILTWLFHHPDCQQFVILDDMPRRFFPHLGEHLVSCNLVDGFCEMSLKKARQVLGN